MRSGVTQVRVLVTSCPKRQDMKLSQCMVCPYFRGIEGEWPHAKVKCALTPTSPREVEILVACPLKGNHVSFKTCLKCPLHRGFYGFHDNSPVVYCGVLSREEERRPLLYTTLAFVPR